MAQKITPRSPWHSVLAQLLRDDLTPLGFEVKQEVEVGRLPLRVDLIIIWTDRVPENLPMPIRMFTVVNIIQYKSPGDTFNGDALWTLHAHALLYLLREKTKNLEGVSLWCLGSKFSRDFEPRLLEAGGRLNSVTSELDSGTLAGFTLNRLDLSKIPDVEGYETFFPAAPEPQARKFLHDRIYKSKKYNSDFLPLLILHPKLQSEEINPMVKLTREEMMQCDVRGNVELWTGLLGAEETLEVLGPEKAIQVLGTEKVLEILGPEKALEALGPEKVLQILGPEKALEVLGTEKVLELLLARQGEESIRATLDKLSRKSPEKDAEES